MRENNLIQSISWYCWPFSSAIKLLHPLSFENSRSQKLRFWQWNFRATDMPLVIKVWSKVLCDRIHRLPNLTIWVCFSLMFLPEVAYYATNNPNHVFFLFFLSFLKVCFHTILNKSKNIVFHVNFPPGCLVCAFDWLQASISSYFTALLPIRRLSFLSHMHLPLFWITVFVNIPQLSFSIFFVSVHAFSIRRMVFAVTQHHSLSSQPVLHIVTRCMS